jgi:pimeloyl-ACP methyl ester carboxylesterase
MEANIYNFYRYILATLFSLSGVMALAQEQLNVKVFNQTNTPSLPTNVFQRVEVDGKGHVWVGTNGLGLVKFNPVDSLWTRAFTNHQVRAITKDSNGDIWVGSGSGGVQATTGGIRKFNQGDVSTFTYWGATTGALNRYVYGLTEGHNNTIWAAHGQTITSAYPNDKIDEGGIGWYDGSVWNKITQAGMPASDRKVLSVAKVGDNMWVGVDRSCINGTCTAPYIAEYSAAGAFIRKVSESLPFVNAVGGPLPRSIYHDSKGRTWVGLSSGDNVVAVYENGSWTLISKSITNLPDGTAVNFQSIKEDNDGNIWIGTSNGLLSFFGASSLEPSNWILFNTEHGLPSNFINGVAIDKDNSKWLSTAAGIVKVEDLKVSVVDPNPYLIQNDGNLITEPNRILEITNNKLFSRVGLSADGVTKLLIVVETDKILNFKLSSEEDGYLSTLRDQSTKNIEINTGVEPLETADGSKIVVAILTAPDSYGTHALTKDGRNIKIIISDKSGAENIKEVNLKIHTPPVVMINGFFSKPSIWKEGGFVQFLENSNFTNIELVNYNSAGTFHPIYYNQLGESNEIFKSIRRALTKYSNSFIAATQVDVVGHSMGGVVARSFIQSSSNVSSKNFNKGYVHKLITIGSPHGGSPLAKILLDNKDRVVRTGIFIIFPYSLTVDGVFKHISRKTGIIYDLNGGALRDLIPSSDALKALKETRVKSHMIVGSYLPSNQKNYSTLDKLVTLVSGNSSNLANLLGDDHDLVVSSASQKGGIHKTSDFTVFQNTIHTQIEAEDELSITGITETNSKDIQNKVKELLLVQDDVFAESIPSNLVSFPESVVIVDNPVLEGGNITSEMQRGASSAQNDDYIIISSPTRGTVYNNSSSTSVTLQFEAKGSVVPIKSIFIVQDIGIFSAPEQAPFNVTFNIPEDSPLGKINFAVLAMDNRDVLYGDTSSIYIKPLNLPVELASDPVNIELDSLWSSQRLNVIGKFVNGTKSTLVDLTATSSGIIYTTQKGNSIVEVSPDGIVNAVAVGEDELEIKYGTTLLKIPVTVSSICSVPKPNITVQGQILTSSSSSNIWYLDNVPIPDAIGQTWKALESGRYTVKASSGCISPMSDEIFITSIKQNQSITFAPIFNKTLGIAPFEIKASTSSGLPLKYSIISGPVTLVGNVITIIGEGSVVVKAEQEGNNDYNAAEVTVTFCVVPAKPILTQEENKLTSSSLTGNKWFFNGTAVDGATSQTYTAKETGIYTVQVSGSCGLSEMSEAVTYTITSVEAELAQSIQVFPNPASEALFVDLPNNIVLERVSLYNAQGKVLSVISGGNKNKVKVNVSSYSKGLHILQIQTDKGIIYKKVVLE